MTTLQVDSVMADSGEKRGGYATLSLGSVPVRMPLLLVNGAQPGPRLALTSGLHYGEFIGIEALLALFAQIDPSDLRGQLVVCPVACPPSFYEHRSNVSPLDGINPNRVYPGSATGRPTERLVHWLHEQVIRPSDVFIDLHSGGLSEDLSPFVGYRSSSNAQQDRRAVELAALFALPVVRGISPSGGNSHAAATRAGVVSLLAEVGSRGSRSAGEIALVRAGLLRVMAHLGMLASAPLMPPDAPGQHWRWAAEVEAPTEGLWYSEFAVGADVTAGQMLGRIVDPTGMVLAVLTAPSSGRVFYGERGLSVAVGDVLAALAVVEP